MKVIAINGSPRKNHNTAVLLKKALDGAASEMAETEIIHLYDLHYQGCKSCFACKLKNGASYGKCCLQDELTPVLEKIKEAGVVILGSPIYLGTITGEMKSFIERLVYPYLVYDPEHSSLFNNKINVGLIYTFGADEQILEKTKWKEHLSGYEALMKRIFGKAESLFVMDTYQFDDYAKYMATAFDVLKKEKRRQEIFPQDCQNAFALGKRLAHE